VQNVKSAVQHGADVEVVHTRRRTAIFSGVLSVITVVHSGEFSMGECIIKSALEKIGIG